MWKIWAMGRKCFVAAGKATRLIFFNIVYFAVSMYLTVYPSTDFNLTISFSTFGCLRGRCKKVCHHETEYVIKLPMFHSETVYRNCIQIILIIRDSNS